MMMICCKLYPQIEGRKKNLVPKLDYLMKRSGLHKSTKARHGVIIGQIFFLSY
jgi:hypothetical protein